MGRFEGPSQHLHKPLQKEVNEKPKNTLRRFFDTLFSPKNTRPQEIKEKFNKSIDTSITARQKLMTEIHQPNVFQKFLQKIKSPFVRQRIERASDYYVAQDKSNNCGPTACAIAAAKLLGKNPKELRDKFTQSKPGAMGWNTPAELLEPMGLQVRQTANLSPQEIREQLSRGNTVLASVTPKSGLTGGGHITALTGVVGDKIINSDPNNRNIQKGYGTIDPKDLGNGGARQFWVVSRNSAEERVT